MLIQYSLDGLFLVVSYVCSSSRSVPRSSMAAVVFFRFFFFLSSDSIGKPFARLAWHHPKVV